jgi:deazaflavin-dependent oxidoreductase (nitroreductase family)
VSDWNAQIIEEFRANEGRVGGMFEGAPLLLLHSTGAKSGEARVSPVMYQSVGDDLAIFASYAGAPNNPAWYHNLLAKPEASVEVGTESMEVTARVADDGDRMVLVASRAGTPRDPGWLHNLDAQPDAEVRTKHGLRKVTAHRASPEERDQLWTQLMTMFPAWEMIQNTAERPFPVVILEPRS